MKPRYILVLIILYSKIVLAQNITIDSCLLWARTNVPIYQQLAVLQNIETFNKKNLNSAWYPNLNGTAQASIQSDVTKVNISIPGFPTIVPPNKDQYKFFIDAGQLIYDGGSFRQQKKLVGLGSKNEQLKVETELFKIKELVIQNYFSILSLQEQIKILNLSIKDMEALVKKSKLAIDSKVISGYQYNLVLAEQIKLDQRKIELSALYKAQLINLSQLTNKSLTENSVFETPAKPKLNSNMNRPEIKLIDLQKDLISVQSNLNNTKIIPKLAAFAQGGYANPGLNFLKNSFELYYIAGLKLNWNISSIYNLKREKNIFILQKSISKLQEENLSFNINLAFLQKNEEILKFEKLMLDDEKLIELRTKIKDASKLQYENGTMTLNDYLQDLNASEQAKMNLSIHQLSYLQNIVLSNHLYGN